jgi:chromate transport protein ChrA
VGSLALIAVVAWQLGKASITDWLTVSILFVSVIAIFGFRVNSVWLILGAAIVGWIAKGLTRLLYIGIDSIAFHEVPGIHGPAAHTDRTRSQPAKVCEVSR